MDKVRKTINDYQEIIFDINYFNWFKMDSKPSFSVPYIGEDDVIEIPACCYYKDILRSYENWDYDDINNNYNTEVVNTELDKFFKDGSAKLINCSDCCRCGDW